MLAILEKMKEAVFSVLPLTLVVLLLHFLVTPLESHIIGRFLLGTLLMIIGMPLFLFGVDISITPIGEKMSEVMVKSNKLWVILLGGCFFGFIVTVAEPDLHILAGQVKDVTSGRFNSDLMVIMVSAGVGFLIAIGMLRILKNVRLHRLMTVVYIIIFVLGIFSQPDFLAIAFDASGSTTGSVSVPFILAMAAGISSITRSNETEENDGFGMLGIGSAGAIIAVLVQGIFTGTGPIDGSLQSSISSDTTVFWAVIGQIPQYAIETLIVLSPILIIYLIVNAVWMKAARASVKRILVGSLYTYLGLVIFLTGVNTGFIGASTQVGYKLASLGSSWSLIVVGMLFGVITIPAEPSVHILTKQIEDETAGSIKALTVMITLCIGVGVAVGLSILRILIPGLMLWHILLPGMIIAIILSYIVPDIFVGIAYDSGGVAAGTMTACLILPFSHGIAEYIPGASVVQDGFGMIALVAMTPLISLQILGLIYKIKSQADLRNQELIEIEEDWDFE